jgi:hypothetical protein
MVGVMVLLLLNLMYSYCANKGEIILDRKMGYVYVFLYFCFVAFSVVLTKIGDGDE